MEYMSLACAAICASFDQWSISHVPWLAAKHELHAARNQGLPIFRQYCVTIGVVTLRSSLELISISHAALLGSLMIACHGMPELVSLRYEKPPLLTSMLGASDFHNAMLWLYQLCICAPVPTGPG